MRIDVKKFLFVGLQGDKEEFFKKAQEAGIIHFINMDLTHLKEVPADVRDLTAAIKVLRGLPVAEQEETDEYALAEGLAQKILQLKHHLEKLSEDQRVLKLEMSRVSVYGDFSKKEIEYLQQEGKRKVQFFYGKQGIADDPNLSPEVIFVGSEHNLDYFVAVNKEPKQYDRLVEMQIDHPYGELQKSYEDSIADMHATEQRLKDYAKYNQFLHHALIAKLNNYHLQAAKSAVQEEFQGELFAAEGWVPEDKMAQLTNLVHEMNVHLEEIAIEPADAIPTYLENTGPNRIGEDLVHIYDTPSHTDKDPSLWVLLSFATFFGLIIGDMGYGLVFLLTALFIRYKYGALKGLKNRVWKLLLILSAACIFWGFFSHSFFGIEIDIERPFRKISLLEWLVEKKTQYYMEHPSDPTYQEWEKRWPAIKDAATPGQVLRKAVQVKPDGYVHYELGAKLADGIMMELALLIGIIHICIGFLRYLDRNWFGIGWILFLIGCYLYFPEYLGTISIVNYLFGIDVKEAARDGIILIWTGLGLAFLLAIIKEKIFGLLQVMHLIQVFADVLSYLRLYALGLAGAIVMSTINEFAGSLHFILGAILFFFGHVVNMALGIMGGFIHGLRLNFIEWYHYSFEGGGKMFNPLRKVSID